MKSKLFPVISLVICFASGGAGANTAAGLAAFDAADYQTAVRELSPSAEQGDAEAAWLLGRMAENGWGLPRSDVAAWHWFKRAADKGDPEAMVRAAEFADLGRGVPADPHLAYDYYQRAAEAGSVQARGRLGEMALHGRGRGVNRAEAVAWLRQAAEGDDPEAAALLDRLAAQHRAAPLPRGLAAPPEAAARRVADELRQALAAVPNLRSGGEVTALQRADGSVLATMPDVVFGGPAYTLKLGTVRAVFRSMDENGAGFELLLPSQMVLQDQTGRDLVDLGFLGQRMAGRWSFRRHGPTAVRAEAAAVRLDLRQAMAVTAQGVVLERKLVESPGPGLGLDETVAAENLELRSGLGGRPVRFGASRLSWKTELRDIDLVAVGAAGMDWRFGSLPLQLLTGGGRLGYRGPLATANSVLMAEEINLRSGDQPGLALRRLGASLNLSGLRQELSVARLTYDHEGLEGEPAAPLLAGLKGRITLDRLPIAAVHSFCGEAAGRLLDLAMLPGADRNAPAVDWQGLLGAPSANLQAALGRAGTGLNVDRLGLAGNGWDINASGKGGAAEAGLAVEADVHGLDAFLAAGPGLGKTTGDALRRYAVVGRDKEGRGVARFLVGWHPSGTATVNGRPIALDSW